MFHFRSRWIFRDIASAIEDAEIVEYENNQPINNKTGVAVNGKNAKATAAIMSDTASIQLEFWKRFNEKRIRILTFLQSLNCENPTPSIGTI